MAPHTNAVVRIKAMQFRVAENEVLHVPLLTATPGDSVEFDEVLMVGAGDSVKIGSPTVPGAKVAATVLAHGRDEKIIVFHKRRRKRYQKRNGHRQSYTAIRITSITA
jgi:large subunit ribosomal protein L21